MHGPVSKTFQYLYFIRFSLLLWLFPVAFFALDSGVLSVSTTTLSRAIFVPEYLSGYLCVGFFVTATACVALITARTVVLNGVERFPPKTPDCVEHLITAHHACDEENKNLNKPPVWLENLLASKEARGERRAVLIALIPTGLTFLYLVGCGYFEEVPLQRIVPELILGFLMSAAFWYLVNALYYFAYERPNNLPPKTPLELGKNAARTILLPRRAFWLRMPGQGVLADGPPHTLEDIRTSLRRRGLRPLLLFLRVMHRALRVCTDAPHFSFLRALGALPVEKGNQSVAVAAHFAGNRAPEFWQFSAFGLLDVEDIHGAEADQDAQGFGVRLFVRLVLPAADAGNRRENLNSLLAFLDETAQFLPFAESRHVSRGGPLTGDLQDVAERVVVKARHRAEIGGEHVALPRIQLLNEVIDCLLDELLRGVFALCRALLVGRGARVALRRIFPVRRGVPVAGCAIAGGFGDVADSGC
jgi:hypothetical protein